MLNFRFDNFISMHTKQFLLGIDCFLIKDAT